MQKRKYSINTTRSSNLAYLIGYIATDGSLSKDNRHVSIVSTDIAHIENLRSVFNLKVKITMRKRPSERHKQACSLQIGDVNFYEFLLDIGLTQRKSKTLGSLRIPDNYFIDFLRGCIDGDGNIQIWKHAESNRIQFKVCLCSASKIFLDWVKEKITVNCEVTRGWIYTYKDEIHTLCYGKVDSFKILKLLYYDGVELYLDRKYQIYIRASGAIGQTRQS